MKKTKRGLLELCNKTIIGREVRPEEIEICLWDREEKYKWTIASFEFVEEYDCFKLESCLSRLKDESIDWVIFGELVKEGYAYLDKLNEMEK
jgi:hypothetical protein